MMQAGKSNRSPAGMDASPALIPYLEEKEGCPQWCGGSYAGADEVYLHDPWMPRWMLTDFATDVGFDYSNQYVMIPNGGYNEGYNNQPNSFPDSHATMMTSSDALGLNSAKQPRKQRHNVWLPTWSSVQKFQSSMKPEPDLSPLQLCRVCNDVSTGKHFGVLSCEACKSFFRRSIRTAPNYMCRANKCCEIEKKTRNKCQHCRLKKCFDVGMNRKAVQEERGPYLREEQLPFRRAKSSATGHRSQATQLNSVPGTPGMSYPFQRPFYVPTHRLHKVDANNQLVVAASLVMEMLAKAEKVESKSIPDTSSSTDKTVPRNFRKSLLSVLAWAKQIPMFTQLSVEDQIELINATWIEVNTLKFLFHVANNGFTSQTDDLAHIYLIDDQQGTTCYDEEAIKESVSTMKDIQVDESELSHLKLITLMNPFTHILSADGQTQVQLTQEISLESLESYIKQTKPDSTLRLAKLLLFLSQVKAVSKDTAAKIYSKDKCHLMN